MVVKRLAPYINRYKRLQDNSDTNSKCRVLMTLNGHASRDNLSCNMHGELKSNESEDNQDYKGKPLYYFRRSIYF